MIEMEDAIDKAKNFINEMSGQKFDFAVEEVYLDKTKNVWKITLSFLKKIDLATQLQIVIGSDVRRFYRTVEIDNKRNVIIGMKAGFAEPETV